MAARSMKLLFGIAAFGALVIPLICSASAAKGEPWNFTVDTPEAFAAQAAEVRKEMGDEGRYRELSEADRAAVDADIQRIEGLLQRKGSAEKLNASEQVDLVNAQERINALLTKNDGNRLICTLEERTGTKFKVKVCQTAFQREEIRRKSQQGYRDALMQGSGVMAPGN